jgi:hypothetical protein
MGDMQSGTPSDGSLVPLPEVLPDGGTPASSDPVPTGEVFPTSTETLVYGSDPAPAATDDPTAPADATMWIDWFAVSGDAAPATGDAALLPDGGI